MYSLKGGEVYTSDLSFDAIPDLVVIDGGKGQLSSAVKVLNDIGLSDMNIIGLAKRLEEVFLPAQAKRSQSQKPRAALNFCKECAMKLTGSL